MTRNLVRGAALAAILISAAPASAQLNGENLLGDMGVKSGTQPEPGTYVATIYYRYFTDTIKGPDGSTMTFDPTGQGSQTIQAGVPLVIYDPRAKGNGRACGRTVELVDLHATLADLCGLDAPKTDGESLRDALAQTNLQNTVIGPVKFNPDGTGVVDVLLPQWQNGKAELVWPRDQASAPIQYPAKPFSQR